MARAVSRASRSRNDHPLLESFDDVHLHEFYELFCLVSGDVEYLVEGTVYALAPGDMLLIKPAEAHCVRILSDTAYERITVHFSTPMLTSTGTKAFTRFLEELPVGVGKHFCAADHPDNCWLYYMDQIQKTTSKPKRELYISILISELSDIYHNTVTVLPAHGLGVIPDIINYIGLNLTTPLCTEDLCSKFYISRAQLNRKFKAYTGSSVWDYITNKRLLLAKGMLQSGDSPATACTKCGFNEYTAFYRAYKAKFGISPKQDLHHKP